jgi:hypothetical protein
MESLLYNSAPQAPEDDAAVCFMSRFRPQFLGDVYGRNGDVKRLVVPFLGGGGGGGGHLWNS